MASINSPFLSFCIPVYNREDYIYETLVSILEQECSYPFDVIVSDNCSTDNTFTIVSNLCFKYPNLRIVKMTENKGADINYLNVVNQSNAKYCWLFGSDDILLPSSLSLIVEHLQKFSPEVCLSDQFIGNKDAQILYKRKILSNVSHPTLYSWSNSSDFKDYLSRSTSQSSIFGFLSIIIFDRLSWQSIPADEKYIGSLYIHAQKLFCIVTMPDNHLLYLPNSLVIWRGGNDSFGGPGKYFYRYNIDFDGFRLLHDDFIPEHLSSIFKTLFRRHHSFLNICYLRLNCTRSQYISIKQKLSWYGYPEYLIKLIQSDLTGKFMLSILYASYKSMIKVLNLLIGIKSKLG